MAQHVLPKYEGDRQIKFTNNLVHLFGAHLEDLGIGPVKNHCSYFKTCRSFWSTSLKQLAYNSYQQTFVISHVT